MIARAAGIGESSGPGGEPGDLRGAGDATFPERRPFSEHERRREADHCRRRRTGTLGRGIVGTLRSRGHRVRVLSRRSQEYRVDLTTGEGLDRALEGCDVVVDASNSTSPKGAAQTLVEGSRRLLAAEEAAGVRHHVCVSVVGCERVPFGY
ncbi:SDR family oxidoreductase [Streptomyces sp. NBC_00887]|uniref:SDR family oxidoreductase n=1 Tax=Streptomyces sp. NBC_00887 TaxID=2975859 RepID=UPI003866E111|nr:NAD(P)H-binding protein [Streptomyces sp. NBC_00887]